MSLYDHVCVILVCLLNDYVYIGNENAKGGVDFAVDENNDHNEIKKKRTCPYRFVICQSEVGKGSSQFNCVSE